MKREKIVMAMPTKYINEIQARACVNRFLLAQAGSLFCAGEPELEVNQQHWRVPVLMVTPGFVVGQVGEALVDWQTREILSHTRIAEMQERAAYLRTQNHAAIKTAFLRTRKG